MNEVTFFVFKIEKVIGMFRKDKKEVDNILNIIIINLDRKKENKKILMII